LSDKDTMAAYGWYYEADAKYSYFVAGVAIALTGYLGQDLKPVAKLFAPAACETLAVVAFLVSSVCALERLKVIPDMLFLQAKVLHYEDDLAHFRAGGRGAKSVSLRGMPLPAAVAGELADTTSEHVKDLEKRSEAVERRLRRWTRARDFTLILGLLVLVFARIRAGYSDSSRPKEHHAPATQLDHAVPPPVALPRGNAN